MFFDSESDIGDGSGLIDMKKVKKIEFSQSLKKDKDNDSLPFTHSEIDRVVFQGTLKDKDFNIDAAK